MSVGDIGGNVSDKDIQAATKATYMTKHSAVYTVSNIKVEGNIFHVHATMDDSNKLMNEFESTLDTRTVSCCKICCDKCCCIWKCFCSICCICCQCPCCKCCKTEQKFVEGSWFGETSYHVVPGQFTDEVCEEIVEGTENEFPDVTRHGGVTKKAWRTSAKHYVKLMYWDHLSDSISLCSVLLKKDEPFSKINKFVSYLGNLSVHPDEAKWKTAPGSYDMPVNHEISATESVSGDHSGHGGSGGSQSVMKKARGLCKSNIGFCFFKCCFPVCTVAAIDGFSCPALCFACCCQCCFTQCCWKPKNR